VAGLSPAEVLLDYLESREMLLALDNCEHLIEACAGLADDLLRSCPRLKILATSREALRVPGERAWLVPSLSLPDAREETAFGQPVRHEAVRLFAERAAAPGFELDEHNAPFVARICQRLDGMPLAIELAAVKIRELSASQIAARLDDRFLLLTGGSRGALPRRRTLLATMDWNHEPLSERGGVVPQDLGFRERLYPGCRGAYLFRRRRRPRGDPRPPLQAGGQIAGPRGTAW
jgi:predicted ATPase